MSELTGALQTEDEVRLGNGIASFGLITRFFHWLMALGLIAMLAFGTVLARQEPSLDRLWMYGAHKTIGISLLVMAVLRVGWHLLSRPPGPIPGGATWQIVLARMVHRLLYVLMLAMPLSGWFASSASGIDTVVFRRWTLPPIAPVSEPLETVGFAIHGLLGWMLALLLVLHVAGAVKRRDGTLRRMWRGTA